MDNQKIIEFKKILQAKIDQLWALIGDSMKIIHFDIFKINNSNLDDSLLKIRKIFEKNPWEELEVLIMKKDLIKLTEDFLKKDILNEIEKESKKLKTIRYIYMRVLIIFTFIWVLFYSNLFKNLLSSVLSSNHIVYKHINCNYSLSGENRVLVRNSWFIYKDTGSVAKIYQEENIVSTGKNILSGNIRKASNKLKLHTTDENISMENIIKQTPIRIVTGNFILFRVDTWNIITGNLFSWILIKQKILYDETVKLIEDNTWITLSGVNFMILSFSWSRSFTGSKYQVISYLSWTLTWDLILGKIKKISLYKPKQDPIFDIDINYKLLKGKQLQEYKKEKKEACPYTGYIYVKVRALNLREKPTKYSRKILLLKNHAKLKVLGCQKNLKSNSWWYKVYIPKLDINGWVSTIGVSK